MQLYGKGRPGRWHISEAFRGAFSGEELRQYDDFLDLPGTVLKLEDHTTIRKLSSGDAAGSEFVLKQYNYSLLARLRSWHRISKAEREYQALTFCRAHGIPAVDVVGYGAKRSVAGPIASCFLITRYADGYMSFRDWLRVNGNRRGDLVEAMVTDLGRHLRRAHTERFFFMRLLAKNILVREREDGLDWLLLDQCYARRLRVPLLGRSAQLRDVGSIIASISRYYGDDVATFFYAGYLPDPLGKSDEVVRRRGLRGARIYRKQMPLTRLVHWVRAKLKPPANGVSAKQP